MSDDIQTVKTDYAEAMEMLWRQSQTIKRLQQENEKLRAALMAERDRCAKIAETLPEITGGLTCYNHSKAIASAIREKKE